MRADSGQTLMEVLVALVVVAVGLGYLMAISITATERGLDTAAKRQAQILARQKVEELIVDPEAPETGEFEEVPGYRFESRREELELFEEVFVTKLTVQIRYPSLEADGEEDDFGGSGFYEGEDGIQRDRPGVHTLVTFLPPEEDGF